MAVGTAALLAVATGTLTVSGAAEQPLAFVGITPCRILDTRPAPHTVGTRTSPLSPDETLTVDVRAAPGNCDQLPPHAEALSLNVTAVDATDPTFFTVWPADTDRPLASSLNPAPGQPPTPNAVVTALSDSGRFSVYNLAGSAHVVVDVTGYHVPGAATAGPPGPPGLPGTANVIHSPWFGQSAAREPQHDESIDATPLRVLRFDVPELNPEVIDTAAVDVYLRFSGPVVKLPYTSNSGSGNHTSTIGYFLFPGELAITRYTDCAPDPFPCQNIGFGSAVEFRYVMTPGAQPVAGPGGS